jgi:anti-sigma factor RsiW
MQCHDFERLILLYACDELDAAERAAVEQHVAACPACAAVLERERRWLETLAARPSEEPSPVLLAQCRSGLDEAIDDLPGGGWRRWVEMLRPTRWIVLRPALSAVALVLLGILVGNLVPAWLARDAGEAGAPVVTVSGFSDQDLRNVAVSGINWVPGGGAGAPAVEVQMMAEKPVVIRGSVADSDVRRVLLFVVRNDQRFDSGVRLESVEALRSQGADAEVRQALAFAARKDRNPGVRLKALESLRDFARDADVRQALLDALVHDDNPGVRVEAINTLRALCEMGGEHDKHLVEVLKDRMQKDTSTYVRMQSAAAIRQLGPRQVY